MKTTHPSIHPVVLCCGGMCVGDGQHNHRGNHCNNNNSIRNSNGKRYARVLFQLVRSSVQEYAR
jgi:hypothetical protein